MATLSVTLPAGDNTPVTQTRMVIRTVDGSILYNVRMAPKDPTYTGFGNSWSQVAVPGLAPFLVKEAVNLKVISFSLIIADPANQDADIMNDLRTLKSLADTTKPIKIAYGGYFESFTWRMTNYEIDSEQRNPGNSKITRATVNLEFTQKNDVADYTGPVTGGAKATKSTTSSSTSSKKKTSTNSQSSTSKKKTATKVYVVKKGDTLSGIAYKLYGDTSKWRDLAKANGITNPRLLQVGTKLKY